MSFFDFFTGGNSKVAARSTMNIFDDAISKYGNIGDAYKFTYMFRYTTIKKNSKYLRDMHVINLFMNGEIRNFTDITVANLNTGAAPRNIYFEQTYVDFQNNISKHLRKFGLPEQLVTGDNTKIIEELLADLKKDGVDPFSFD